MRISVIIPSWKREKKLNSALESLTQQLDKNDSVIVVHRPEDEGTISVLKNWMDKLPLIPLKVEKAGVINAENCAIEYLINQKYSGVITFMDDDAMARPHWISSIKSFFTANPDAAALGGPDIILSEPESYHQHFAKKVGIVTFSGRVIGNHHRKSKGLREVDALKGVNFSFSSKYLSLLDTNLQGEDPARGNGVFWELELCMRMKAKNGKIFFDPELLINHDSNHSHFIPRAVIESSAHNIAYVMRKHLPTIRYVLFVSRSFFIGNSHVRGIIKTLIDVIKMRSFSPFLDGFHSLKGFFRGLSLARNSHLKIR